MLLKIGAFSGITMDIDIDFKNRDDALKHFKHIVASRLENDEIKPHNTGVYFTDIPHEIVHNLATIEYKEAEKRGYFKVDFLNVNVYSDINSEQHIIDLMNQKPIWELFEDDDFIADLFHINGYGDLLRKTQPKSLEQLAAVLAMIRPSKKHLVGKDWNEILKEVWVKPTDNSYYYKKSHAISYAMAVIVQANRKIEKLNEQV